MTARLKAAWAALRASKPAPAEPSVELTTAGLHEMQLAVERAPNGMVVLKVQAGPEEQLILFLPRAAGVLLLDRLTDVLVPASPDYSDRGH
jgi:hypothetical protein